MRSLDLADVVALAAEVSEVEVPKLVELLDTAEVAALLADAQPPVPPHEAAATLLVGLVSIAPLPTANRRLALLAALQLLAVNGLEVALDPGATRALLSSVAEGSEAAATVAAWLDLRVTARDPLEDDLRRLLSPDAWRAVALALQRAGRHRRRLATPADLLLGLFREGTGPAALALGADGRGMEAVAWLASPPIPERLPAYEPEARKVFELALRASTRLGHREVNGGHLLLGLLDGGHTGVLPEGLDPVEVRRRLLDLAGPGVAPDDDLAGRLDRLASRLRVTDPAAGVELDEVAELQGMGLDRLTEMIRAWRGEIFLEAMAREPIVARLLGRQRLGDHAAEAADDDLLARYLAAIAGYAALTRAEEADLAESIRTDVQAVAAESRRQLIEANLRVVVSVARRYEGSGLPLLDLIHAGNMGLQQAADGFDATKGYRFTSFARWWIRQAVVEAVARRQQSPGDPASPPVETGNNRPMATDRYVLHVTPNANGWEVKQQGSDETEWLVDDKDNAVNHARDLAKANQPSQIIIHTRDGRIETEHTYGDDPRETEG
ncbi:MAG: sigma-70 family RNA polymerase sigma factor [Acidimicrobiales bacterium]